MRSKSTFWMSRSGIDLADVRDGGIVEGADHVRDGVHLADVGDDGVAQAGAGLGLGLRGVRRHGGNVHVLHRGVHQLARVVERGEAVEAVVGDLGDADVRFARIGVRGRELRLGQDLEQRRLAYLRQADDSGLHKNVVGSQ